MDAERDGFYQAQLIRGLGVRHIVSWSGVELEGGPAPPTPENVAAVMALYPVGERFFQEFTLRQVLLNAAPKSIRALCRWHFQPGGGPDYCRACRDGGQPCARGEPGARRTPLPLPRERPDQPPGA